MPKIGHLVCLVALVAAAAVPTANGDDLRYELESKLTQLYDICASDETCSMRFYLRPQHVSEGNDVSRALDATSDLQTEHHKFFRILVAWAHQDACPLRGNSLRPRVTPIDFDPLDAAWWLTVMNTARICADNQVWEIGRGCVANAERLGQSDAIHAHTQLDSAGQPIVAITITVSCITILGAAAASVYYIEKTANSVIKKQEQLIDAVRGKMEMSSPSPTTKLVAVDLDGADDDSVGPGAALEVGVHRGMFG